MGSIEVLFELKLYKVFNIVLYYLIICGYFFLNYILLVFSLDILLEICDEVGF